MDASSLPVSRLNARSPRLRQQRGGFAFFSSSARTVGQCAHASRDNLGASQRFYAGGIWAVIDIPVEHYLGPAQRINITVPQTILTRIDSYAKSHGMSRSGFLVDARGRP
ncbi:MAG: type II toxin-antitoxin system HicB family antitoxin [Burkholderiaceae bacterium]|jgi:hypothetical protein|nr:type II toxin-antitoxin system HicB family antitoxin [Burkholderiaceae bacterium]